MNKKIAGVVIWYNPKEEYIKNIETYLDFLDILYVYDNSNVSNISLLEKIKSKHKIKYINKKENFGIAHPLNEVAEITHKENFEWLLTMDQDSYFIDETIQKFSKNLKRTDVGILCPTYILQNSELIFEDKEDKEITNVITSGNLINLNIYKKTTGFDNNLFIDEVDHDYCLKINLLGKKIIQQGDIYLNHELGERKKKYGIYFTEHSFIRKYYIWRNKLYMVQKYPHLKKKYYINLLKDLIKIIFLEMESLKKINYISRGIKDYSKKKWGKFDAN